MTALSNAKTYLATLKDDGRTRYDGHPDVLLAALVAEIDALPVVPVSEQVAAFWKPIHEIDWSDVGFRTTYVKMIPCNQDGSVTALDSGGAGEVGA